VLLLLPTFTFTQTLPQRQKKVPGRDPVMVIDKLMPGKSKHYSCSSESVKFTIGNADEDCRKVNVSFNNKPLLQHHCLAKEKSFNLKLSRKINFVTLTTDHDNGSDSTFASVMLSGGDLSYTIKVWCAKNKRDTIFIGVEKLKI